MCAWQVRELRVRNSQDVALHGAALLRSGAAKLSQEESAGPGLLMTCMRTCRLSTDWLWPFGRLSKKKRDAVLAKPPPIFDRTSFCYGS